MCDILIGVDISFDYQTSHLFVKSAEVTSLICGDSQLDKQTKRLHHTNMDVLGCDPVRPPSGWLLNEINVLALKILRTEGRHRHLEGTHLYF
jgi:hypothetical protein